MVLSPHTLNDVTLQEAVQRHAARRAYNSRWDPITFTWSVSSEAYYHKLRLPSLCIRGDYLSVCALQDIRHTIQPPFNLLHL